MTDSTLGTQLRYAANNMRKLADSWGARQWPGYTYHIRWNSDMEKEFQEIEARFKVLELEHTRLIETMNIDKKIKKRD